MPRWSNPCRSQTEEPSSWPGRGTLVVARLSNPCLDPRHSPRKPPSSRPSSWPDRATLVLARQSYLRRGRTEPLSSQPSSVRHSNPRHGRTEQPSPQPTLQPNRASVVVARRSYPRRPPDWSNLVPRPRPSYPSHPPAQINLRPKHHLRLARSSKLRSSQAPAAAKLRTIRPS